MNTINSINEDKVCAWLRIAFPDIRDIDEKVLSLPLEIKGRITELVEDIPGDYWVTTEGQIEIQNIYTKHLRSSKSEHIS